MRAFNVRGEFSSAIKRNWAHSHCRPCVLDLKHRWLCGFTTEKKETPTGSKRSFSWRSLVRTSGGTRWAAARQNPTPKRRLTTMNAGSEAAVAATVCVSWKRHGLPTGTARRASVAGATTARKWPPGSTTPPRQCWKRRELKTKCMYMYMSM